MVFAVSVVAIQHWRAVGIDTWITSDGRAYFVQLHELQGRGNFDVGDPDDDSNVRIIFRLGWRISYHI